MAPKHTDTITPIRKIQGAGYGVGKTDGGGIGWFILFQPFFLLCPFVSLPLTSRLMFTLTIQNIVQKHDIRAFAKRWFLPCCPKRLFSMMWSPGAKCSHFTREGSSAKKFSLIWMGEKMGMVSWISPLLLLFSFSFPICSLIYSPISSPLFFLFVPYLVMFLFPPNVSRLIPTLLSKRSSTSIIYAFSQNTGFISYACCCFQSFVYHLSSHTGLIASLLSHSVYEETPFHRYSLFFIEIISMLGMQLTPQ